MSPHHHHGGAATTSRGARRFAIVGSPNSGKTTLFNALTGLRAKTGNYPGVTVARYEGLTTAAGERVVVEDLPGTYSLDPISPDEVIVTEVIVTEVIDPRHAHEGTPTRAGALAGERTWWRPYRIRGPPPDPGPPRVRGMPPDRTRDTIYRKPSRY